KLSKILVPFKYNHLLSLLQFLIPMHQMILRYLTTWMGMHHYQNQREISKKKQIILRVELWKVI
ncbi:hypothetical protein B9K03_11875, partial [Rothia sp. Olga]